MLKILKSLGLTHRWQGVVGQNQNWVIINLELVGMMAISCQGRGVH